MAWGVKVGDTTATVSGGVWSSADADLLEMIRQIDTAPAITGSAVSLDHALARYVAEYLGVEMTEGEPFTDPPVYGRVY